MPTKLLLELPSLPPIRHLKSPAVVLAMDKIRRDLDDKCGDSLAFEEFYWFAREYPRHYRYFLDCADHRLRQIHHRYEHLHEEARQHLENSGAGAGPMAVGHKLTWEVQWDFDHFLMSINSALDLLARIIGPAYKKQAPISFNKITSKVSNGPGLVLAKAKNRWVLRLKSYRDCIAHFAPLSNWPMASLTPYSNGWELGIPLPSNPSIREPESFRRARRCELLRYSCSVHRHMAALDREMGRELLRLYKSADYPIRTTRLFGVN